MSTSDKIVEFINKHRKLIITLWILAFLLITVVFAPKFFGATKDSYDAPKGSEAAQGMAIEQQYFPEHINDNGHIVVIDSPQSLLTPDFQAFTLKLVQWANTTYPTEFRTAVGYYLFAADPVLSSLAPSFMSADNKTSFISLTFNADANTQKQIAIDLVAFVKTITPDSFKAYVTGFNELSNSTNTSIEHDLSTIDSITVPLVFILLIVLLGNWRYFPITFAPILMTIGISLGLMERYIAVSHATVQSFVPSVLISIVLGVGVDYCLFLLTRFKEERHNGKDNLEAVKIMMEHAGHTVLTSGGTLTIAMTGMIFFPVTTIASVGIAITIGVAVLLMINLTFTPALLLTFGNWLEREDVHEDVQKEAKEDDKPVDFGMWYKIGKFSSKHSVAVLGIILLLTLPLSAQLINTTPNANTTFFAPIGSDSGTAFNILQDKFGSGSIGPLNMVIAPNGGNVWTQQTFTDIQTFVSRSVSELGLSPTDFNSIAYLGGNAVPLYAALSFTDPQNSYYNTSQAELYRSFALGYVSSDAGVKDAATYVSIILPVDPYSPEARQYYHDMSDIANQVFNGNYEIGFSGPTVIGDSSISQTYNIFPLMILIIVIAIYCLVGIMFKALILPARLIATIALTLSFIYGAATVVFQYSWFINSIFPETGGIDIIFWMMPVMSFSIILGLGIDYDIFTIERIKENVWNGMPTDEAIAHGLEKTGRIITGAGIIMAISFGGMMFSSSYVLIQFGFVLAFAVLLDTFIVRSLLVPAIMSLAEDWNWWPNHPPVKPDIGEDTVVPMPEELTVEQKVKSS